MKHRKKRVVIEAVKFTDKNKNKVYAWASIIQQNIRYEFDKANNPILKIPTLEGEMECSLGDYIIVKPFPTNWNKLYPCKPDIFKRKYKPVND